MSCHNSSDSYTETHPFNEPLSQTTRVSRYQEGKTNLDFTEARDSEWQWHQQGHMHVCTSLQTDNHASTPPLSFLQARHPSCCPTNSVKALKASCIIIIIITLFHTQSVCLTHLALSGRTLQHTFSRQPSVHLVENSSASGQTQM